MPETVDQNDVLLVGISHRQADIEVRERLFFPPPEAERLARTLAEEYGETVVLSTCNRTELYFATSHAEAALARAGREFQRLAADEDAVASALYTRTGDDAVLHLFRVAAGLESLVLGEAQILGQVRDAHQAAKATGAVGPVLDRLFRDALRAGRRARALLEQRPSSVAVAAVELVRRSIGELADRRVLLIGAGKMSEQAASTLAGSGADVAVTSRTLERAEVLARRFKADALPIERIDEALMRADAVISSTRCPQVIVAADRVAAALARRHGRPIVLVDIAVPRDLDPAIGRLEGCRLYDIDDVAPIDDSNAAGRPDVQAAEQVLVEEAARFRDWQLSLAVVPAIASLRKRAEAIRSAELARVERRLRSLSRDERVAVESLTSQLVNKLLHGPTVRMKEAAGGPEAAAYARALEHLFSLEKRR